MAMAPINSPSLTIVTHTKERGCSEFAAITKPEIGGFRLANASGVFQDGVEDRLQFAWRTGNDFQHLAGRGLLIEGFTEVVGPLAQLVEQACIFDGNDRLRREV